MQTRKEGFIRRAIALMAVFVFTMIASAAFAQGEFPDPRMDVFVGYSYYNPGDQNPSLLGIAPSMGKGFDTAVTWNFNRYVGLTFDTSGHYSDQIDRKSVV